MLPAGSGAGCCSGHQSQPGCTPCLWGLAPICALTLVQRRPPTNPKCPGEVPCPSTQQGARALLQPCGSKTSHLHAHKQILSWLLPWQLCTPSLCWGGGCILERCPPHPASCLLCTPRPVLVRGTKRCQVRGLSGTVWGLRQQLQGANSPCLC